MKKQIATALIFFTISSQSQIIRDLASDPVDGEIKKGYYIKDINNYFNPFVGTWSYTDGNTEFRIYISKVVKQNVVFSEYGINYFTDGLELHYEKYENRQLIFASPQTGVASGISKEAGIVYMSFVDYEREQTMVELELKKVVSGLMAPGSHYEKISFKLNAHERRNTYYDTHPNEPFFSVPDNIELVWHPQ